MTGIDTHIYLGLLACSPLGSGTNNDSLIRKLQDAWLNELAAEARAMRPLGTPLHLLPGEELNDARARWLTAPNAEALPARGFKNPTDELLRTTQHVDFTGGIDLDDLALHWAGDSAGKIRSQILSIRSMGAYNRNSNAANAKIAAIVAPRSTAPAQAAAQAATTAPTVSKSKRPIFGKIFSK